MRVGTTDAGEIHATADFAGDVLGGHDGDRDRRELHPVGGGLQSLSSQRKRLLPAVVAQDPVVTDLGKSGRQNVERQPTDKLYAREDQVLDLSLLYSNEGGDG